MSLLAALRTIGAALGVLVLLVGGAAGLEAWVNSFGPANPSWKESKR